jgi:Tfp pilus assembly protein PilV
MISKKSHIHSGSSLIEVIVMMVILSMAILGVYGILQSGQKLLLSTQKRIIASDIARTSLESVISLRDTFLLN